MKGFIIRGFIGIFIVLLRLNPLYQLYLRYCFHCQSHCNFQMILFQFFYFFYKLRFLILNFLLMKYYYFILGVFLNDFNIIFNDF